MLRNVLRTLGLIAVIVVANTVAGCATTGATAPTGPVTTVWTGVKTLPGGAQVVTGVGCSC